MSKIKYRVWDFNVKQMQMVTEMYFDNEGICGVDSQGNKSVFIRSLEKPQEISVMQYTGNMDKHNIEICEGDILKVTFEHDPFYDYITEVERKGVVHTPKYYDFEITLLEWLDGYDDIEIIGNIHENPELLAQKAGVEL